MNLQTENLTLVVPSTKEVLARIESMSPADQAQVSPDWVARLRAAATTNKAVSAEKTKGRFSGPFSLI